MKRENLGSLAVCIVVLLLLFAGAAGAATRSSGKNFAAYKWTDFQNGDTLQLDTDGSGIITIPARITSLTIDGQKIKRTDTCIKTEDPHPGVVLTVQNLEITAPHNNPGIDFRDTTGLNKLLLSGTNAVTAGDGIDAGIYVPEGISLTIDNAPGADGSITATGNCNSSGQTNYGGAGIGGAGITEYSDSSYANCGTVTIDGGTVVATGGYPGAAGIGGGSAENTKGGNGGTVTINGGHVTATSTGTGAGIGSGNTNVGGMAGGAGGTVTITGGVVVATSATGNYDIGRGYGSNLSGPEGTTVITGGSVKARAGKVDAPKNGKGTALTLQTEAYPNNIGKTVSFRVDDNVNPSYDYIFTVPDDGVIPPFGTTYLWLPDSYSGAIPTDGDLSTLTAPSFTGVSASYSASKCVVSLAPNTITLWDRIALASMVFFSGTGSTDDSVTSPGIYRYRAKTAAGDGPLYLTAYSDYVPITLKAPAISGPSSMALTAGYAATSTDAYTIMGNPAPTVSKTAGNDKITWDGTAEKLEIASGLTGGTYPVILTAVNGLTPAATFTFTLTVKTPASDPPPPSSNATPSNVRITVGGTTYRGERTGETFTITVPNGTNVSSLDVAGNLPWGATSEPKLPAKHNFNDGPLTITVTAEDGTTKKTYTVNVIAEGPDEPTERQYFTFSVNDCEVVAEQNADGTWLVKIRLLFGQSADPALLSAIKAYLTNLGLTDISYSWVDTDGNATPVTALKASAPYLEISGTAANRDALKNGTITSIQYKLAGDDTTYVQTFPNGGIKIADMPGFPQESPSGGGGSSSSCDAGFGAVAAMMLAGAVIGRRRS